MSGIVHIVCQVLSILYVRYCPYCRSGIVPIVCQVLSILYVRYCPYCTKSPLYIWTSLECGECISDGRLHNQSQHLLDMGHGMYMALAWYVHGVSMVCTWY